MLAWILVGLAVLTLFGFRPDLTSQTFGRGATYEEAHAAAAEPPDQYCMMTDIDVDRDDESYLVRCEWLCAANLTDWIPRLIDARDGGY